jgi:hypothetical protein
VRAAKRRSRPSSRPLPIQGLYPVGHLAPVVGITHRHLQRLLKNEGVQVYRVGRFLLVPLTELEEKVPVLWDSIKAAELLRRALDDA